MKYSVWGGKPQKHLGLLECISIGELLNKLCHLYVRDSMELLKRMLDTRVLTWKERFIGNFFKLQIAKKKKKAEYHAVVHVYTRERYRKGSVC